MPGPFGHGALLVLVSVLALLGRHRDAHVALPVVTGGAPQPKEGRAEQGHLEEEMHARYTHSACMVLALESAWSSLAQAWSYILCGGHLEDEVGGASNQKDHCGEEIHPAPDGGVMDSFHEKGERVAEEAVGSIPQFSGADAAVVVRQERHQNDTPQADLEH